MAGREIDKKEAAKRLLNDENWQVRLEDARARREKALREKERLKKSNGEQTKPVKPWEAEVQPSLAPIVQESDPPREDLDFADRVDAIRQTARHAPEPNNDTSSAKKVRQAELDEETFLQEAAATLQPKDTSDEVGATDPGDLHVLSERYAAALNAYEDAEGAVENTAKDDKDVVVDLAERYGAPELQLYPGADPELAKRYAAALAAFSKPTHAKLQNNSELSVAAGGRRLFMLSSLALVVGFLTLPLMSAQPVATGPKVTLAPGTGLQPGHGAERALQGSFAVAVPLLPRVAPVAPALPVNVPEQAARVVPTPSVIDHPVVVIDAPSTIAWADAPVQAVQSLLHDPLVADHTLVAGLSPDVTGPAEAVIRPQRVVQKLPEFNNVRVEVEVPNLDGSSVEPLNGTLTVTALEQETTFDALAAAIAEDVARSLRR